LEVSDASRYMLTFYRKCKYFNVIWADECMLFMAQNGLGHLELIANKDHRFEQLHWQHSIQLEYFTDRCRAHVVFICIVQDWAAVSPYRGSSILLPSTSIFASHANQSPENES
jgi:hypothetical protein